MSVLAPAPKFRAVDDAGNPLVGGKLYSYTAGTSTPKATYVSIAGAANANPVILDARGEADVWLDGNYKLTLTDADDAVIWTVDDIRDLTSSATLTNATLAGSLTVTSTAITWSGNPVTHAGNHAFTNNVAFNGTVTIPNDLEITGGELTFTPPNGTFTPGVTFGGNAVGVTYNINRGGVYEIIGSYCHFYLQMRLSSKGSSTGQAAITGLPFACDSAASGISLIPVLTDCTDMTGMTGVMGGVVAEAGQSVLLTQTDATGSVTLTDAAFTNSSTVRVSGFYPI